MPVVYQITSPSGKSYIGVAKRSALERFKKHCADARLGRSTALCASIRKYGQDAMTIKTLLIGESRYCFEMEMRAIAAIKTMYPSGYNLTNGGEGVHEMAEVSKLKHKAAMVSKERIDAIRKASIEYHNRPEVKAKKSAQMKARWKTKAWRKHMKSLAAKKKQDAQPQEISETLLVQKSCDFCYKSFECEQKVSTYKRYCCRSCSQAASYKFKKQRMNERY